MTLLLHIANATQTLFAINRYDDEIFEHTLSTFPELKDDDYAKLIKIDEDWMKTKEGKERWRKFIDT